ncbi:MAG: hypothetical protein HFJ50_08735 [Clostridia bacterium]|jgi:hypothetical protein|nr:hypothetical protein [Clostridia bacterium]
MSEALIQKPTWEHFLEEMKKRGFKIGFSDKFEGDAHKIGKIVCEREIVLFNETDGIIVYAETKNEQFLGTVTLFGELACKFRGLSTKQERFLSEITSMKQGKKGVLISMHLYRQVCEKIDMLRELFGFVSVWDTDFNMNFLNYMQRAVHDRNHQQINKQKISRFSEEVIRIMHQNNG